MNSGKRAPQGRFIGALERALADVTAPPSSTPLLLRDADFAQTLQHLADLYRAAEADGPATRSVDRTD